MNPNQPAGQPGAQQPAAPAAGQPPVSDAAAMGQFIGGLGPAPAPSNVLDFGDVRDTSIMQGDNAPMVPQAPAGLPAPQYPAAPQLPGAPVQPAQPPQYPQAPIQPQYQQPQQPSGYTIAGAPATPAPGAPIQPQINPDAIPLNPALPQAQVPPADQIPAWAQGIMTQNAELVRQLAERGNAPAAPADPANDPNNWDVNKPQGWGDVQARIQKQIQDGITQGLTAAQQAQQQQTQQQQAESDRQLAEANAQIDNQLNSLRTAGYLPPITAPGNPNDPGQLAQNELLGYAVALQSNNLPAVATNLLALHNSGYTFDYKTSTIVRRGSASAAAAAPIAGASPTLAAAPGSEALLPTMADLRNLDMATLAERANQAYPAS